MIWLKKTTWLPLSSLSNTGNIDFNFSPRNDAKDSDNVRKRKTENSWLAYDEVQKDNLPSKDKKIDENQPGPSRRRSERLSYMEEPTVEPPVGCSNLDGYKFIYWNVLNELISKRLCCQCKSNSWQLYQKDLARIGIDERLFVYCHNCNFQNEYSTSCKSNTKTKVSDVNLRGTLAIISAGGGTLESFVVHWIYRHQSVTSHPYNLHLKNLSAFCEKQCQNNLSHVANRIKLFLNIWVPISQNGQTHSNNSSADYRRIVWVCLTILWDWCLKG